MEWKLATSKLLPFEAKMTPFRVLSVLAEAKAEV